MLDLTKTVQGTNKKLISTILFIFASLFVIFKADPFNSSVEKNIYDFYSESIVSDMDFNLVNQIPQKEMWQITITGNYPDVHSNGISVLWAPFFLAKQLINKIETKNIQSQHQIFLARTLANAFYGLLFLIIVYRWIQNKFPELNVPLFFVLFYLSTSHYFYLVISPGNADITSAFIGILEIMAFESILKKRNFLKIFSFGLLLGYGIALKVDHVFYLLLPIGILIELMILKVKPWNIIKESSAFLLGLIIPLVLIGINDYIKFGRVGYGYFEVVNTKYYLLFENLFYPTGFFNNNPIYLLSFIGILLFSTRSAIHKNIYIYIPIVSLLTESFAYIHQESYGGRHWIAYYPSLMFGFFHLCSVFNKKKYLKGLIFLVFAFSIFRNFITGYYGYLNPDRLFFGESQLSDIKGGLFEIINFYFFNFNMIYQKVSYQWPIILLVLCLLLFAKNGRIKFNPFIIGVFLVLTYGLMTTLNVLNNAANFKRVKDQVNYDIVGSGPNINSLYENLGTIEKSIEFYKKNRDDEKVSFLNMVRLDYIKQAASEIVEDRSNFKEKLLSSKEKFIPENWRDD